MLSTIKTMKLAHLLFRRCFSSHSFPVVPKICVVGAGPAGFYAAQHLVKKLAQSQIDIYERYPVPYGLVRFGVAPDHPEVKNVEHTFSKTAEHPNVRFIGNVKLGSDIFLKELKEAYHVVVLTYGAEEDRKLNIPGEDLTNVLSARRIVGWYNGLPCDTDLKIDLSGESVAIFGQGNVAIDVARILLSPIDELRKTDITEHALAALSESKVKEVHLIGRRGPLQAAFTIKELREMINLKSCKTLWNAKDFEGVPEIVPSLARPKKRITELMLKSLNTKPNNSTEKIFRPVFFRAPLELRGDGQVKEAKLGVTKLEGEDILNKSAVLTDATEMLPCQLAVKSIGYRSIKVDEHIPFDDHKGVAKHDKFKIDKGVYTTGWLSTGPTGVILTTMNNAFVAAEEVMKHMEEEKLLVENKPGLESVSKLLKDRSVKIITWEDWLKIDSHEQEQGKKVDKPREKVTDVKKMLEIVS